MKAKSRCIVKQSTAHRRGWQLLSPLWAPTRAVRQLLSPYGRPHVRAGALCPRVDPPLGVAEVIERISMVRMPQ